MTPMYYPMNKLGWYEQSASTNIFDEEYYENHHGRLNRRLIISSNDDDDNAADAIPSVSCSADTVPNKDMSLITLKHCEEFIVSPSSCDDDDDNDEHVSYSDSSYEDAMEQLDFRRFAATEARDDDSYDDNSDDDDDDCIVFRRIESNILSYPRPRTSICRQSLECTSTDSDENDSVSDLWTLKRAHPILEDDEDYCNDEEPTSCEIGSNVFDETTAVPAESFFISFNDNNGISVLNPRKRQKYEDLL